MSESKPFVNEKIDQLFNAFLQDLEGYINGRKELIVPDSSGRVADTETVRGEVAEILERLKQSLIEEESEKVTDLKELVYLVVDKLKILDFSGITEPEMVKQILIFVAGKISTAARES